MKNRVEAERCRRPSYTAKKNVRFLPSYNFGIDTGPPKLAPNSLRWNLPSLVPLAFENQLLASILLLRKNSNTLP